MTGPYSQLDPPPSSPEGAAAFDRAWVESLPDGCLVLDRHGTVVAENEHWRRFASEPAAGPFQIGVGANFLRACADTPSLEPLRADVARLLAGEQPAGRATAEVTLPVGPTARWYQFVVTVTGDGALVSQHELPRRADEQPPPRPPTTPRHYYDELLTHVPAVVWEGTCHPDGTNLRLRFVSEYAQRLTGISPAQWLGVDDFFTGLTHAEDRPAVQSALRRLLEDPDKSKGSMMCRWITQNGQTLWVESHVTVVRDAGEISLRGATTDVTARRQWDDSLRQRNAELAALARSLKRSNEELDQYAYVTSHDLKAPLRGIANLSTWIEEDLGPVVTEQAHGQLELLRGRVHRMERLIDGILAYSRVGRTKVKPELVPVAKLLRDVIDLLSPPKGFIIDVEPGMPTVMAERTRLQQVFMNLISNAIKHHHNPSGGRVKITAREEGDCYEFSVTDDGPGIDPAYHHKVWQIFQTLQPRDQVEGTGVGLSLVRKIVEDQGGTVRLESAPGRGSTFSFTWQKDVRTVRPQPQQTPIETPKGNPHGS